MKIKDILKENQPEIYKKLNQLNFKNKGLTFEECEKLMGHNCYKRHRGAIRQVR